MISLASTNHPPSVTALIVQFKSPPTNAAVVVFAHFYVHLNRIRFSLATARALGPYVDALIHAIFCGPAVVSSLDLGEDDNRR